MKTYELTYIISARITSEETATVAKNVEAFIQEKGGVIMTSQKSQAQTLAYPIKKQSSGYFATTVFQAAEDGIKPLQVMLEAEKEVLRSIVLIKKPVKEVKERRTRKPVSALDAAATPVSTPKTTATPKNVNEADLDKKLDEILG